MTPMQQAAAQLLKQRCATRASRPWASAMALEEARWALFCVAIDNGESIETTHKAFWSAIRADILARVAAKRGSP